MAYILLRTPELYLGIRPVLLIVAFYSGNNNAGASMLLTTISRSPSLSRSAYMEPWSKWPGIFIISPISLNYKLPIKLLGYLLSGKIYDGDIIFFIEGYGLRFFDCISILEMKCETVYQYHPLTAELI